MHPHSHSAPTPGDMHKVSTSIMLRQDQRYNIMQLYIIFTTVPVRLFPKRNTSHFPQERSPVTVQLPSLNNNPQGLTMIFRYCTMGSLIKILQDFAMSGDDFLPLYNGFLRLPNLNKCVTFILISHIYILISHIYIYIYVIFIHHI